MPLLDAIRRRAEQGDPAAFAEIVRATAPRLLRASARILGDQSEAEDVLQECYVRAWRALAEQRFAGRSELETWLYRIVCNATLDALRARRRRDRRAEIATTDERIGAPDSAARLDARLALRELGALMEELPPEQRVALVLKELEGMPTEEIARFTESSVGAVEQRLVRARATLRAAVSERPNNRAGAAASE